MARRATGAAPLALTALLAGCTLLGSGGPPPDTPAPSPLATQAPTPQRPLVDAPIGELLFPGSLLICSDLPYPPQEFFDERGDPVGSDIEIGQEIARRMGLEARVVNSLFETIIDAVNAGKCDIVISAQNITAERAAQVDMIPYFQAGQAFVVKHGNPAGIRTELDLCGRTIASQTGTVQEQQLRGEGDHAGDGLSDGCLAVGKPPIEVRSFEKDDEALQALIDGSVDAYFTDSPAAGYHVVQNMAGLELSGLTLDVAVQGISVPKNRPRLREAVAHALETMFDDGTYLAILARYGVEGGSVAGTARP